MAAFPDLRGFLTILGLIGGFWLFSADNALRAEEALRLPGEITPFQSKQKGQPGPPAKTGKRPHKRLAYKRSGICRDLDRLARKYNLPPLFFARLIWQESRFNPYAVSPAGAEGIAQFMPGTALIWGLDDPFEPGQALIKSAQYLSYLHNKLGNLGYAAAGYNAGSGRVTNWINGSNYMPLETRNYVQIITGYTIEEWSDGTARFVGLKVGGKMSATACKQLTVALQNERPFILNASLKSGGKGRPQRRARRLPRMPWGVQLAGSFSRHQAMRQFRNVKKRYGRIIGAHRIVLKSRRLKNRGRRVFHRVRVGTKTRSAANKICRRLRAAGGSCVVLKN